MTNTLINRNNEDLHFSDKLARLRMRDWMQAEQRSQGLNDRMLAERVGHHSSWSHGTLKTTEWRVATLQKAVRAFGYTLTFNVDTAGVVLPAAQGVSLSEVYAAHPDPEQREEAARIDLGTVGRRFREAVGLTPAALGHRLNQEGKSVTAFEGGDHPYYLLVTAQRFFRALGGSLELVLVNADGEPFPVPEGPWVSELLDTIAVTTSRDRTLVWNTKQPENVVSFSTAAWERWVAANGS